MDVCIKDALFHLDKVREILTEGLKDPDKYYNDSMESSKMIAKILPFIVLLQLQSHESQPDDRDEEENLPESTSSSQSSSDNYEPESQQDH